jgi:hypothetical protein
MFNRLRAIFLCVFCVAIAGCAATGKPYKQFVTEWHPLDSKSARIVFYKLPKTDPFGILSQAVFSVNGETKGAVMWGGFNMIDLPPGELVLAVTQAGGLGSCKAKVTLEPGKEYFFKIDQRYGQAVATIFGGLIGAIMESAANECGGAYKFDQIDPSTAKDAIAELKLSN